MASFDPAAATAAYMAQLSPAAHLKATHYTQGGHWLLLWGALASVIAAWLILRSGVLKKLAGGLQRRKPRPVLISFLAGVIYIVADFVIELPWTSYADWWREGQYGLTSQSWVGWLTDNLVVTLVSAPFVGLFFLAFYALIRRAPRTWPLWTGALAGAFALFSGWAAPVLIEPLINNYQPAPPGPVRELVVTLGKATGVPTDKIFIYNGSKQSNRYTANVAGLFGTARVALSDTMFRQGADLAEVRGVVGHEMGHYVHLHLIWNVAFSAVTGAIGAWLVMWLFPIARGWLGAGDLDLADPVALPVVMIIISVLSLLATPVFNTETRLEESDADSFSLEHAHEPDGLSKALVKTIEYRASSPSDLEEFLFYNHPSVEHRVRKAMDWKAAHPDAKPVG
jgi:STE24 endopeptidase